MKPRLVRAEPIPGLGFFWFCDTRATQVVTAHLTLALLGLRYGRGKTPVEAYDAWLAMRR